MADKDQTRDREEKEEMEKKRQEESLEERENAKEQREGAEGDEGLEEEGARVVKSEQGKEQDRQKKKRFRLTLNQRRAITGYLFIAPFILGFLLFFLRPMIQSVSFALSELEITHEGFVLHYVGLENFYYAFRTDANFVRIFTETVMGIVVDIPAIIIFSFFAAALLNQKFRGRLLARVIFFLPVILTAGIIAEMEAEDMMHQAHQLQYGAATAEGDATTQVLGTEAALMFGSRQLVRLLLHLRLPIEFLRYIIQAVARIPEIITQSAIPILIFLAGLQSIPASLYEAADIEGATAWENFWKITFPLVSPLLLTNIVFIIIQSFTAPGNELVHYIDSTAWGRGIYGVSVAMTWVYFAAIAVILGVVIGIVSKHVFYME